MKASSLFYSKKETWWLIGFSMILSSGILVEPQIMCAALSKGNLSDMWIYWSGILGAGFSIAFFAHLWKKVPVKTENEFILFRFSGMGAQWLHGFRSLYVGGIIVPFIIAFSLLAYSKIVCFILGTNQNNVIELLVVVLLLGTFFNSLKLRLRTDFILFIFFIIIFIILVITIYSQIGGLATLASKIKQSTITIELFPSIGTTAFNGFLVFILVQWWSASILDYPDMNGQKLMASKSSKAIVKSVLLPSLLLLVFRLFAFTLPFIVVVYGLNNGISDGELAFTSLFVALLPSWMLVLVIVFFGIPFLSLVQNNQNWGGSLLVENFYKHHLNPKSDEKQLKKVGNLGMLFIVLMAGVIALYSSSLMDMIKLLFAITAGVGPVFILRWYWWRINAWSQLSAMVAALIYPAVYEFAYTHFYGFRSFISTIQTELHLEYYPVELLVLTFLVCATWLTVTFLTKPTDEKTISHFVATVQPGGFWNGYPNTGNGFFGKRVIIWLLLVSKGFITFLLLWNFVLGNYIFFVLYSVVFMVLFYAAYQQLTKVNT